MDKNRPSRQPHPFSLSPPASIPPNQPTHSFEPNPAQHQHETKTGIIGQYPDRDRVPKEKPRSVITCESSPFSLRRKTDEAEKKPALRTR
jgi:hypothetical protein